MQRLPGADAAGGRSRPSLSAPAQPLAQHRGASWSKSTRRGGARARPRSSCWPSCRCRWCSGAWCSCRRSRASRRSRCSATSSPPTSAISSPATRCGRRRASASRATRTCSSTRRSRRICSSTIQEELRRRELGAAVRLELAADAVGGRRALLSAALKVEPADIYRVALAAAAAGPDGARASSTRAPSCASSRWCRWCRRRCATPDVPIFDVVSKRDILLHHPYESFDPVVRFIEEAADDPNVLAIKMTLYRTRAATRRSCARCRARRRTASRSTVLVEIKARFDEANNIAWARRLEENGVHVVYGLIGYKTHCKVALVVRREGDAHPPLRAHRHRQLQPARRRAQYTDLSFLTTRPEIAEDASALFNMLTGYSRAAALEAAGGGAVRSAGAAHRAHHARGRARQEGRAGAHHRQDELARRPVDHSRALRAPARRASTSTCSCAASAACAPGVKGLSERIRVISVVDRFLEHSRVFAFGPPEACEVFIASADWMPRNFVRRIEVMCPIEDPALKQRLLDEVLGDGAARQRQGARAAARRQLRARRAAGAGGALAGGAARDGARRAVGSDAEPQRSRARRSAASTRRRLDAQATQSGRGRGAAWRGA